MTIKELLKIINSCTDEERYLALVKIKKDFEILMNVLKKTDYFDTDDLMNGVNKDNGKQRNNHQAYSKRN